MNVMGIGKLLAAGQRLRKRFFGSGAVILMYHRIAKVEIDPWSLCVTPSRFAEHLDVLQRYHCMLLEDLSVRHRKGRIPRRGVVVTFDDGYADNLHNGKPLLERYGIPATFFLTTGYIGQGHEFWWDELEQLLLRPGQLEREIHLTIEGNHHQWELGEAAYYGEENYMHDRGRRAWEGNPGSRLSFYYSIWQLLKPLPEGERQVVLDEIRTWAKAEPMAQSTDRSFLPEEIYALKLGKLVEIGAHTVTHLDLSAHGASFQFNEIRQSKAYLENILGHQVNSFSYPFGDFTAETVSLVRQAGFMCACTTNSGLVQDDTDFFRLPRIQARNWSGEEFNRRLETVWTL
jgi:peptidoglycan/xylan/chitin deacetylase (PgdA/CDA1 family)